MNILRALMVMLFISTLPIAASAGPGNDKDGTQGTVSEPDCDDASATEYLWPEHAIAQNSVPFWAPF